MKDKIIHLIASEDSRNPMTDEEIAETLGIFRETVTNIRKEAGLGDSCLLYTSQSPRDTR